MKSTGNAASEAPDAIKVIGGADDDVAPCNRFDNEPAKNSLVTSFDEEISKNSSKVTRICCRRRRLFRRVFSRQRCIVTKENVHKILVSRNVYKITSIEMMVSLALRDRAKSYISPHHCCFLLFIYNSIQNKSTKFQLRGG